MGSKFRKKLWCLLKNHKGPSCSRLRITYTLHSLPNQIFVPESKSAKACSFRKCQSLALDWHSDWLLSSVKTQSVLLSGNWAAKHKNLLLKKWILLSRCIRLHAYCTLEFGSGKSFESGRGTYKRRLMHRLSSTNCRKPTGIACRQGLGT